MTTSSPQEITPPKVGDMLTPDPMWNSTTISHSRKLPLRCRVEEVSKERNCETGYMVTVLSMTGAPLRLSYGWFLEGSNRRAYSGILKKEGGIWRA